MEEYILGYQLISMEWDELDHSAISEFAFEHGKGIYRTIEDIDGINRYLTAIESRYPSERNFIVYFEGEIQGWAALGRSGETLAELGRWQPVIRESSEQGRVATMLIQNVLDYAKMHGITHLEFVFNGIDQMTDRDYTNFKNWLEMNGVPLLEETAYLVMENIDESIPIRDLPEGFTTSKIGEIERTLIHDCHYQAFITGDDREFLEMTKEQRIENFERILQHNTLNDDLSWVLFDDAKPIAFAIFLSRDHEEHLDRFGILKEYRGKGIAKSFLLHTIRNAAIMGKKRLSIGVDTMNTSAFSLYENVGFQVASRTIIHSKNLL